MRFDPFRDLDRVSEQLTRSHRSLLAMDAVRDEQCVTIYMDVPGVPSDQLEVTVEKNELIVSAERRWEQADEQVVTAERPQGVFRRSVMLGDALDPDQLTARTDNGVLIITIPVAERSKPRRIDVASDSHGEAIEANSTEKRD